MLFLTGRSYQGSHRDEWSYCSVKTPVRRPSPAEGRETGSPHSTQDATHGSWNATGTSTNVSSWILRAGNTGQLVVLCSLCVCLCTVVKGEKKHSFLSLDCYVYMYTCACFYMYVVCEQGFQDRCSGDMELERFFEDAATSLNLAFFLVKTR